MPLNSSNQIHKKRQICVPKAFFVRIEVTYVKEVKKIKQIMNKLIDENLNQ